jgi:outer membrane protein TolC
MKFNKSIFIFIFFSIASIQIFAQADSVSLESLIKLVVTNYPSVNEGLENINSSDFKINLAKSNYLPDIALNGSYTRLGPVSELEFPGLGLFQLYPANNYNASIDVRQNLYDFGKTSSKLDLAIKDKELAKLNVEQIKQKLSLVTMNTFYNMLYLQEAIKIKEEQIKTLNDHLTFVQKKLATGSSTNYEVLATQVRITNAESQKTDLESAYSIQSSILNSLLNNPEGTVYNLKKEIISNNVEIDNNKDIENALQKRDEINIAKQKELISQLNYNLIDKQDNPNLNLILSGGYKNGYIPDLNKLTANFVASLQFSFPLFDAFRTKNNLLIAQTSINSSKYETDITKRNITNEVIESNINLKSSLKKIEQFNMQVKQAGQALNLAQVNFKAGAITNLDLLDAETSFSESELLLLKAQIDFSINYYKAKLAIGEKLY